MKSRQQTGFVRKLVRPGLHKCTITQVIDLGTQKSMNSQFEDKRKLQIVYELKEEGDYHVFNEEKGKQPHTMIEEININVDKDGYVSIDYVKSNLGKRILQYLGEDVLTPEKRKDFDLKELLGKNGNLMISHYKTKKGETRDKILAASPKEEGVLYPKNHNPFIHFGIESDDCLYNDTINKVKVVGSDKEVLPKLPKWIIKKIVNSPEWKQAHGNFGQDLIQDNPKDGSEDLYEQDQQMQSSDDESPF